MRTRGGGHITNVSSIGVQTTPPRFSAYVASKAALDAFTRVAAGELHGDAITFTTIHMPLVRTPMIEPTRLYDSFPALSPQAAADMIVDSITRRPRHIGTPLGGLAELAYAATPRLVERILGLAYRAFPDSPATDAPDAAAPDRDADGSGDEPAAAASAATSKPAAPELTALVRFLRGVHW
jgi:NAD(P)-dependent dehydrogenase (short-subunit alcohol dehydrogenase family)